MKLPDLENWTSGKLPKSTKIWLSKSIIYVKNYSNLSDIFSLKNTNLGAHFLLLTFAKDINKSRIYRGWILRCIINLLIYNSLIPQGFVETLTGLGGIIFLISDGCIGINLFYYKLEYAQFIIMSTYYLAQFLITLSGVKTIAEEKANKIRWYTDLNSNENPIFSGFRIDI